MESEDEEEADIMESEDEEDEEEAEQLEEMRPPLLTSWMGPDGITVHGIMCIDDGIIRLKNRCQLDDCSISLKPSKTYGNHQICCLPCGHMYGFSCIKKWLLLSDSIGKCPQCNEFCLFEEAKLLYPPRLCITAHQKASSAATLFPFTKQGYPEFEQYEFSRMLDAQSLLADDIAHENILVRKHNELEDRRMELVRQWDNFLTQAEELEERAESLGQADASRRRAYPLKPRTDALGRRTEALRRLVSALRRRMDALEQRSDAFETRVEFYIQMYKEHHKREVAKAKQDLERKKKLAQMAAAKAKKKGQEEAEKAAEKKLKDKERNDKKKMHASGTVEVPGEETVEDVAEEPEEEKVEKMAKPTTKTTELRSRSNRGNGPDSISKVIPKCTKSNNYMYYYAAVLIVPLAVGYTLYA